MNKHHRFQLSIPTRAGVGSFSRFSLNSSFLLVAFEVEHSFCSRLWIIEATKSGEQTDFFFFFTRQSCCFIFEYLVSGCWVAWNRRGFSQWMWAGHAGTLQRHHSANSAFIIHVRIRFISVISSFEEVAGGRPLHVDLWCAAAPFLSEVIYLVICKKCVCVLNCAICNIGFYFFVDCFSLQTIPTSKLLHGISFSMKL